MKDLLGDEMLIPAHIAVGKRKSTVPRGYAMPPGTGPAGETCRTCKHHVVSHYARDYHKCALIKWTHGRATDILVRSPACSRWEPRE